MAAAPAPATASSSGVVAVPAPGLPRLHVIAGDEILAGPGFADCLGALAGVGGSRLALHLRARSTSVRRLFSVASRLTEAARAGGTLVVVNDRLDVALGAGAGGVQLREDSMGPPEVRAVLGAASWPGGPFRVGRSIHSPEQAAALAGSGVDWLVLGSVYATSSHPGGRPIGPGAVGAAASVAGPAVLAIGGIGPAEVPPLLSLGAHGVVVKSGVWGEDDPPGAVARYLEVLYAEG